MAKQLAGQGKDVLSEASALWKMYSELQKAPYVKRAEEDKARYRR